MQMLIILLIKYIVFYAFFYLMGRSFLLLIQKFYFKKNKLPEYILYIKSSIIFPVIGLLFTGNLLVLLNFLIPLKSDLVLVALFLFLVFNLLDYELDKIYGLLNVKNFNYFILIPAVLIVSSYSISFHYYAGFYHLLSQNWLRESELVIGKVNIFWPLGISSIYEYISSILWIDGSFILLHYLNLIFVHFFIILIWDNLLYGKVKELHYFSYFILIFSILDNFGFQGGRNGYLYLDGITKQDVTIGILFCVVSFLIFKILKEQNIKEVDLITLSLLTFFIFQIKISSVFISSIYLVLIITLIKVDSMSIRRILKLHIPVLSFSFFWFLKNYLSTGCLVFPFSASCINNFDWFVKSLNKYAELSVSSASIGYIDYMTDPDKNFNDWFSQIIKDSFYVAIFKNFIFSLLILLIIRHLFFIKTKPSKRIIYTQITFLFINLLYLVFYGPIPRYSIGLTLFMVSLFSFYVKGVELNRNQIALYSLLLFSLIFTVRMSSYQNFLNGNEIAVFDATMEGKYSETSTDWVIPNEGDQCWVNINCTSVDPIELGYDIKIENYNNYFNVARIIPLEGKCSAEKIKISKTNDGVTKDVDKYVFSCNN